MNAVRGLNAVRDTHGAVTVQLRRLGDNHSGFMTPEMASQLQSSEPTDLGPWVGPAARVLDGKFAYIMIPGYIGSDDQRETRFADEIQAAIRDVDSPAACGWIVDLRSNTGGNVWPMLAGLDPILGDDDLSSVRQNDGSRVEARAPQAIASIDYELATPKAPIALLIGPRTASSGEAVALSFVGRADTRSFGMKTRGQTTGNQPFVLADGALLNLATSVMTDRFGREYAQGIEPDVVVEEPPGTRPLDEQAAVRAAVEWLAQLESCDRDP